MSDPMGADRPPTQTGVASPVSWLAPGGAWRARALAAIALVAAGPTLVWAFTGARFLYDDWWLAESFSQGGLGSRWDQVWAQATAAPARPGSAVYYALSYGAFGRNPVLHAVLLAVVNGVLGVLVFLVAERLWRTRIAFWITVVYVVLPNRGSTRMWFAVATYPLAVVFLLIGVLLLLRGRVLLASWVLALGVLTYEGVAALALLAVVAWAFADLAKRWRTALLAAVPVVGAAALLYLLSPKRSGLTGLGGFDRLMMSQFGVGTFQWPVLAQVAGVVLFIGLVVMVMRPSENRDRYRRVALAGLVILLVGWAPYFLTNWPMNTDGFFDRASGVVGLGTAVLVGALLAWLADVSPRPFGALVGVALVLLLLGLNAVDVRGFREAVRRGDAFLAQVAVDVPPGSGPIRITASPELVEGLAQFPVGTSLSRALYFRRGDRVVFWIRPDAEESPLPADPSCYDYATRVLGPCPDSP